MERLIDNALIYGSMVHIDRPHLVERYNQALQAFGLPPTERDEFSIDATGYSPEIAADLGDEQYLDPHGVNRRFIILMPEQSEMPVVHINFSSTIDLMQAFYRKNAEAIKVLSLKDVIYGEIEDSTYRVDDIDDILAIKRVKFQVHTHNKLLEKSRRLTQMVGRLKTDEHAWKDSELLEEILELAKECGDTRYNRIVPRQYRFASNSFWTRHLGGMYVFHDKDDRAVVIGNLKDKKRGDGPKRQQDKLISIDDHAKVFKYLSDTGRLEPLNMKWLERSKLLELRYDLFIRHEISSREPDRDIAGMSEVDVGNWLHDNLALLRGQKAFQALSKTRKAVLNRSKSSLPRLSAKDKLMLVRAKPGHPDAQLVNRFLSEFVPFDFLTRFIVNKQAFYEAYKSLSDVQKDYVVGVITSVFFPNKERVWQNFFDNWKLKNA